ncbi:MAG: molecular chaperone HtpG [Wenzhouxiangellaceae bacterium]
MSDTSQRHEFQAEVQQVLKLVIHSLYSNPEIFLRELISNAADACDKLRFEALQDDSLLAGDAELHIDVLVDKDARTLTIRDNGIGMSETEVVENLGTIARSGTRRFLESMSGDARKDSQLIGQFGVGFYSAFIVADKVRVETRRAGASADEAVLWEADDEGGYEIKAMSREARGTDVILYLKEDADQWLETYRLRQIIHRYSDHIGFPIRMEKPLPPPKEAEDGEEETVIETPEWETVNEAKALWTLPKNEIEDEQYQAFYRHLTHDNEAPLAWAHNKVEGRLNYTSLLYIPGQAPYDLLLNRDEREGLKLYVRRVLIMDAAEQLLPNYLRFVRGVVDADDLPLNVSRELLQEHEHLNKIKAAVIKRSLDLLEKMANNEAEDYIRFWKAFGPVLKEGVVEDFEQRDRLNKLLRFHSTAGGDDWVSLDDYVGRMKEGQDTIWYLTAENEVAAKSSPQLEAFRKAGLEVLLLSDRVDEWMVGHLHEYEGKQFRSAAKGELDLTAYETEAERTAREEQEKAHEDVLKRMAEVLAERVDSVRASRRLADSASCLVASENAMALHLQRMLQQAGQSIVEQKPTLEVNLSHPLVQKTVNLQDEDAFKEWTELLFEQAALVEGGMLREPAQFVERLNRLLLQQAS